jgi:hypothetical protein
MKNIFYFGDQVYCGAEISIHAVDTINKKNIQIGLREEGGGGSDPKWHRVFVSQEVLANIAAAASDFLATAIPYASSACPICTKYSPHVHSPEEAVAHRNELKRSAPQAASQQAGTNEVVADVVLTRDAFTDQLSSSVRWRAPQAATTASASDAEEAAKLQTLLMTEFECYRTAQGGLYAWAINALLDNSPHRMDRAPVQAAQPALPSARDVLEIERTGDFTVRIVFNFKEACDRFLAAPGAAQTTDARDGGAS